MMKIVHMVSDGYTEFNSSNFRSVMSGNALRAVGHQVDILPVQQWIANSELVKRACVDADLVIVHRVMLDESIKSAQYWIQRGVKVVCDFDDGYKQLTLDSGNPAVDFWIHGNVTVQTGHVKYKKRAFDDPLDEFERGLSSITGGLVPSRVLVRDYQRSARMFYLPNYVDGRFYEGARAEKKEHEGLIFGGGWSLGHLESIRKSGIVDAFQRVLNEYSHVKIMIVGDHRIMDLLPFPPGRVIFRPYVMFKDWPETYASFDVSIAPLHGPFDMRRSFIKAEEACLMGTPLVATGDRLYPVYEDFFDCPSHVYVPSEKTIPKYEHRVEKWYEALSGVAENYDAYYDAAQGKGKEIGAAFDVRNNVDSILAVYEDILETP